MLSAQSVWKSFGTKIVLKGVSVDVQPGKVTALVGRNGSGKTTLLNILTGLEAANRGAVVLNGNPLNDVPTHERSRRGISRTFQKGGLPNTLTPVEALELAQLSSHLSRSDSGGAEANSLWRHMRAWTEALLFYWTDPAMAQSQSAVKIQLAALDLDSRSTSRPISQLSGGQRQRLSIGTLLVRDANVWLLDEPTANIDQASSSHLAELIRNAAKLKNTAILMVEHNLAFVESVADVIYWLDEGSIAAVGDPGEVLRSEAFGRQYLGIR